MQELINYQLDYAAGLKHGEKTLHFIKENYTDLIEEEITSTIRWLERCKWKGRYEQGAIDFLVEYLNTQS